MNGRVLRINRPGRSDSLKKVIWIGFFVRLFALLFMLTIAVGWTRPYFITDDIKYDNLAESYLLGAGGLIDIPLFQSITAGFMQPFWPWVMCISAYLFRNIYAARFINIILSTLCIGKIYDLTYRISQNEKTANTAAGLFAFLPVTVLTCCFPIKDIFLTYAVLYAFEMFVQFQSDGKVATKRILLCVALLVGVYFTRGAVTELLLLFFVVYLLQGYLRNRRYFAAVGACLVCLVLAVVFKDSVLESFEIKLDDYSSYAMAEGGISLLNMRSLLQLYKMPGAYFFATLQPMKTSLAFTRSSSWWLNIICYLNISIYPIAIGNFLYIFSKKKNFFFWLSSLIMYCAIIYLVLGVFRHYLFLLPVELINYSLYKEQKKDSLHMLTFASLGLFVLILALNALSVF